MRFINLPQTKKGFASSRRTHNFYLETLFFLPNSFETQGAPKHVLGSMRHHMHCIAAVALTSNSARAAATAAVHLHASGQVQDTTQQRFRELLLALQYTANISRTIA